MDLPALLTTLTGSLDAASNSVPDSASCVPPVDGISLLDTKNELLLAYLQNLVFLILLKLRSHKPGYEATAETDVLDAVTRKLAELRVYLEKGVRPLEGKLQYQLDKLLQVANETEVKPDTAATKFANSSKNGVFAGRDISKIEHHSSGEETTAAPAVSDLTYRPNPSAFVQTPRPTESDPSSREGVYRPPRITPTSLPTTTPKPERAARLRKSYMLDDFVREEVNDAPIAEPSIGAGSGLKGRAKEREEERTGYEEQRLIRLPGEGKKGKRRREGGGGEDLTGGFDLNGLGDIEFEASGKRKKGRRDQGGGAVMGENWEKRVKRGVGRKRR